MHESEPMATQTGSWILHSHYIILAVFHCNSVLRACSQLGYAYGLVIDNMHGARWWITHPTLTTAELPAHELRYNMCIIPLFFRCLVRPRGVVGMAPTTLVGGGGIESAHVLWNFAFAAHASSPWAHWRSTIYTHVGDQYLCDSSSYCCPLFILPGITTILLKTQR